MPNVSPAAYIADGDVRPSLLHNKHSHTRTPQIILIPQQSHQLRSSPIHKNSHSHYQLFNLAEIVHFISPTKLHQGLEFRLFAMRVISHNAWILLRKWPLFLMVRLISWGLLDEGYWFSLLCRGSHFRNLFLSLLPIISRDIQGISEKPTRSSEKANILLYHYFVLLETNIEKRLEIRLLFS